MASNVDIANAALLKLGADRIASLSDNNDRARVLNQRFSAVRDAELRRRRWRFALTRASLPALVSAPAFGFERQFQLPADFLRLVQVGEYDLGLDLSDYRAAPNGLWSLEGRAILTSLPAPLAIRYIRQVTDPALFDAAFAEALAARLAWECCERITQSDSKRQLAAGEYKEAIREAVRANAIEAPPEYASDDAWVMARTL